MTCKYQGLKDSKLTKISGGDGRIENDDRKEDDSKNDDDQVVLGLLKDSRE
jgi:hypothetical protein